MTDISIVDWIFYGAFFLLCLREIDIMRRGNKK